MEKKTEISIQKLFLKEFVEELISNSKKPGEIAIKNETPPEPIFINKHSRQSTYQKETPMAKKKLL